jgi:8-oxo-dGTP diphosphatase
MGKKYIRRVQTAVNILINCGEEFLLLKRAANKRVDPSRLNGVGGRLEEGETFIEAAVREIEEEAGYSIKQKDLIFKGILKMEGGYPEDWIMCFFLAKVGSKKIPKGSKIKDGKLLWIHKDKVLDSGYELVDDLNYTWKDIVDKKTIFFASATFNDYEKVESISVSKLNMLQ